MALGHHAPDDVLVPHDARSMAAPTPQSRHLAAPFDA
jgi:hypothetical protein